MSLLEPTLNTPRSTNRCPRAARTLRIVLLACYAVALVWLGEQTLHSETRIVVAGEQYGSPEGGTYFFGKDYRDLWTTPIKVDVLDLSVFAGGLEPVMRVGGNETKGLALKGADGKSYTFRGINKDLSDIVPIEFQDSILVDIVQDQIAANVPGVQVIVPPLQRAAGVAGVREAKFVIMPDSAALGQYQKDFADVLGVIVEYPQPGSDSDPSFRNATEILSPDAFWERRQAATSDLPDTRAFLRARLLDIFLNDYDRHRGQWRWARIPGNARLLPIPEDPDMALTDYQGVGLDIARFNGAPFVEFQEEFPRPRFITKNGWDMDRLILTDIEKSEWMQIANDLQARLTDAVIEDAIRQLPQEYFALRGAGLVSTLQARRDALSQYAEHLYGYMNNAVNVHGSNASELARAEWQTDGNLRVTVAALTDSGAADEPFYQRLFKPGETKEVRIYLHGGNDRLVTAGRKSGGIKIRGIGGPGNDSAEGAAGSAFDFYDSEGETQVQNVHLHSRSFTMPSRPEPNDVTWSPNPDFGRSATPIVTFGYSADPGLILGGGFTSFRRGFRQYPWAASQTFRAAWATGVSKPFVDYVGALRRRNSNVEYELNARFSGIEQLRYYGEGNETDFDTDEPGRYEISNYQFELFPAITLNNHKGTRFAIGPYLQYSDAAGSDPSTILKQEQPTGFGKFGHYGLRTELGFDTRKAKDAFAPGIVVRSAVKHNFEGWDALSAFGSVAARLDGHFMTGDRVAWNLFAGGKQTWGDYPFFEAAYLDGRSTTGYGWNRFAGDAVVYGGVHADVVLGQMKRIVPSEVGFSVFTDAGRVYLDGEASKRWHPSYGVGVFVAPFRRTSLYGLKVGIDQDRWFFVIEARSSGLNF